MSDDLKLKSVTSMAANLSRRKLMQFCLIRHTSWVITLVMSMGLCSPTAAQEQSLRFELTPYAGYRIGGNFDEQDSDGEFELDESDALGIIFNIRSEHNTQWEFLYAHQQTKLETLALFVGDPLLDIDVDYFHLGGTYLFDGVNTRPFLALTVGLSRFEPRPQGFDAEHYISASIGAGVQLRATKRVGVRIEGRVFTSLVDSDEEIFCLSGGQTNACAIRIDGTIVTQWEARAGVVFRF